MDTIYIINVLGEAYFKFILLIAFCFIAQKKILSIKYEEENKQNHNNINKIQYFQYGLELNYFDSSDIEKIKFYLDLIKSNKQNDYDIENIKKLVDKYSQWRENPTIKEKWDTI